MKVTIEVEIPDDTLLSDWLCVFNYMLPDGQNRMSYDHTKGLSGAQLTGLAVNVSDKVRHDQVNEWFDQEDT